MATTRVYDSYAAFMARADRKGNGVSEEVFLSHYECEGCFRTIGRSFRRGESAA